MNYLRSTLCCWLSLVCLTAQAQPVLQCNLTYAGSTQKLFFEVTSDPYAAEPVDVSGRFWFKATVAGRPADKEVAARVDYIALYAYLDRRNGPLILQEAKYLPPFPVAPNSLTGEQRLYAGNLEREFIYSCTLEMGK